MFRNRIYALLSAMALIGMPIGAYANRLVQFENEAKIEGSKVDSAARADDTAGISQPIATITDAPAKVNGGDEAKDENKRDSSLPLTVYIGFAVLLVVCAFLFMKIRALEAALQSLKLGNRAAKEKAAQDDANLDDTLNKIDTRLNELGTQMSTIQTALKRLDTEIKQRPANPAVASPIVAPLTATQAPAINEQPKKSVVERYVDTMAIDDEAKPYVQVRSLKDDRSLLLLLELDNSTGRGTYTINPAVSSPIDYLSTLTMFTEGIEQRAGASYVAVIAKGELAKAENRWKVVKRLKVELR